MGNARDRKAWWAIASGLLLLGGWFVQRGFFLFRVSRYQQLMDWTWTKLRRFPVARPVVDQLLECTWQSFEPTFLLLLGATTLVLPIGFVVRWLARERVRAGLPDPLDPMRRWFAAHPKIVRSLGVAQAIAWVYALQIRGGPPPGWTVSERIQALVLHNVPVLFATFAVFAATRLGLRALLAPTIDADEHVPSSDLSAGDIVFNAVAVTRETRAAVGGMAALSAAFGATFVMLPTATIERDPRALAAMAAYAAVALGGAALFRKASRIAVGVDGVLVTGTSKTRFFAYRDIDDARVERGDVILVRGIREVLRLQLHGDDAARRAAIVEKMKGGDRAREGRDARRARADRVREHGRLPRAHGARRRGLPGARAHARAAVGRGGRAGDRRRGAARGRGGARCDQRRGGARALARRG